MRLSFAIACLCLTAVSGTSAAAQSLPNATRLFDEALYADAKTELLALHRADAANAATYYYLGRIAHVENDIDQALRHFERAVDLESGNAAYHHWLGNILRDHALQASKVRQPFIARRLKREWELALELDPALPDARLNLAAFYAWVPGFMGGGIDRAREQANLLAQYSPMHGGIARGVIALVRKDRAAEEQAYRDALRAAPDSLIAYVELADFYARQQRPEEAFATLQEYARRRADDVWLLYHTGRVAAATGTRLEQGEAALRQFLAAPPRNARVVIVADANRALALIANRSRASASAREHQRTAERLNRRSSEWQRAVGELR